MNEKDTFCRLCSSCCPITVEVENGRLISAKRKSSFPIEKDYDCPKLKAAPDIVYSPNRITNPLVKQEKKSGPVWSDVSWSEVLDKISDDLQKIKDRYGSESLCWMRGMAADWGAPWDYARRFMNVFGSPNVIGNGSVCHVARELAHVFTYGMMSSSDYLNSKCILILGKNDRDTNPAGYESIIYARRNGAKLIVVDPIRTELAEMADIWLQIKPGCDGLLAMSMINVIIREGLYDRGFIKTWTLGFEALKKEASKYKPEIIAKEIWLHPEKIIEAARIYAKTKPACLMEGNGLDMHTNVAQNTRAICILRALSGNLDKKGGDLLPQPVPLQDILLKEKCPKDIKPISYKYPFFNSFLEKRGDHALLAITDTILEQEPYPIKALIIQAANSVITMADSKKFLKALKQVDLKIGIDLFMTRTARYADIILPTTTCFEKTQLNLKAMSNPVILQDQVIDWEGNSRPDWKIIFELGKRMGYANEFPWRTVDEAIDFQLKPSGITVEMLRKKMEGIRVEAMKYEKYKRDGFNTESGKIEFFSKAFEEQGASPIPTFNGGEEIHISYFKERSHFPLIGISGARSGSFTHSQFYHIPALLEKHPEPFVDIHPDDADNIGISDHDLVNIETPKGFVRMKASISNIVHPGSVRIAWGWGEKKKEWNLNDLTEDETRDPITSTPSNRCFMCRITKNNPLD